MSGRLTSLFSRSRRRSILWVDMDHMDSLRRETNDLFLKPPRISYYFNCIKFYGVSNNNYLAPISNKKYNNNLNQPTICGLAGMIK